MIYHYSATSQDKALIIKNWPWGFKLKTEKRFWIETTKRGQRLVSQTKNPKNGCWCTPKRSTYSVAIVLGQQPDGTIFSERIGNYDSAQEWKEFYLKHGEGLDSDKRKDLQTSTMAKELTEKAFKEGVLSYQIKPTEQQVRLT